jgi:hypothetical protein
MAYTPALPPRTEASIVNVAGSGIATGLGVAKAASGKTNNIDAAQTTEKDRLSISHPHVVTNLNDPLGVVNDQLSARRKDRS